MVSAPQGVRCLSLMVSAPQGVTVRGPHWGQLGYWGRTSTGFGTNLRLQNMSILPYSYASNSMKLNSEQACGARDGDGASDKCPSDH